MISSTVAAPASAGTKAEMKRRKMIVSIGDVSVSVGAACRSRMGGNFEPLDELGAGRGTLKAGSVADVTVIDPSLTWTYRNAESRSKSKNSPFDGWQFEGGVVATFVGGKPVFRR